MPPKIGTIPVEFDCKLIKGSTDVLIIATSMPTQHQWVVEMIQTADFTKGGQLINRELAELLFPKLAPLKYKPYLASRIKKERAE